MTLEQKIKQAFGELQFQNLVLMTQLEEAQAIIAAFEAEKNPEPNSEPKAVVTE